MNGCTPLGVAPDAGVEAALSFLLRMGATDKAAWTEKGVSALIIAVNRGNDSIVRTPLEEGLDAVGGLRAIPEAICLAVKLEKISILQRLLAVEGEETTDTWARCRVWSGPCLRFRDGFIPGISDHGDDQTILAYKFGGPLLHCAAENFSFCAICVLLSSGADETELDTQGKLARERIGVHVRAEEKGPGKDAAISRVLLQGPAFRAHGLQRTPPPRLIRSPSLC